MMTIMIGFSVLLLLILVVRVPIAFAMGIVGFFGFAVLNGLEWSNWSTYRWNVPLSMAANRIIDTVQDYSLSVIPLFILMGNLVFQFLMIKPYWSFHLLDTKQKMFRWVVLVN